jgi:hypothetical protein
LEAALETFVDVATGFDAIGASSARRAGVDADADDDDDDAAPSITLGVSRDTDASSMMTTTRERRG